VALRLIDAGTVSPLRSQALWHGIASAMREGDDPVLSLCRPDDAYVGIGYHRRLDELDLAATRRQRVRVIRRQIGGGPVWLDRDQLFFQLTMPARSAPAVVDRLYAQALEPAVAAFRALGADARRDAVNDVLVGDVKVSGTGAGRIGDAVTVVGNVLLRFPHERMADVLALPTEEMREEVLRVMRANVACLGGLGLGGVTHEDAAGALVAAYGAALGPPIEGALRSDERCAVERWETRMSATGWLRGPDLPQRPGRRVKVRAGVHVAWARSGGVSVLATVAGGRFSRARVRAGDRAAAALSAALEGMPVGCDGTRRLLRAYGAVGERAEQALDVALTGRD